MNQWRERPQNYRMPAREPHSEALKLRRCVRDLVALSALPAMWKGYEPGRIAEIAASALVSMLGAEFVYVGLSSERDDNGVEVVKMAAPVEATRLREIAVAVKLEIRDAGGRETMTIANPLFRCALRLAIAPIGFEGLGVIVAGAPAADFPTETQRLLLVTAANKAALGLQRWQSETEMQRFVALIESSSDFVGYADLDGTARYVNPAGMRLVGLHSQEEIRELQVLDFLATEDRARARDEAWPIVKRSGRWAGELTFRHFTTGAGIPFLVDWFRIDDTRTGGSLNIAAIARDLRAQKKSESELRHLNETLENRVVQRTAELADAHKKLLTEMSEHKRLESRLREAHLELGHAARLSSAGQIAAALAHELNQPLTAITNSLGAAKRLLARGSFIESDLATKAMDEAVQQSLRAAQVVSRLRNFLIRGETETRCENVSAMVDDARALALIGPTASGVEIRVLLDSEAPQIVANRVEIQQVLINLMRNALEAMAGMDRRKLWVTTTLRRPDLVEFAVADSGPGIGADMAERIFEPFVTTKRDGMGIGLSICRSIIETHGSRLQFEPNPDGGTIFHFTLPAVLRDRELDVG
jgi:two-component system, LuxR family, sensor kinase FixL